MKATEKLFRFLAAAILILAVGWALLYFYNSSETPPVSFGCLGVASSSNINSISIGVSNYSGSAIVYLVCPPVVKSNVVSADYQFPAGKQMEILKTEFGTTIVTTPSQPHEARVPILWGFYWGTRRDGTIDFARRPPIQAPTVREVGMQSLSRHTEGLITGQDPNGMGTLYTNYLTVKP